MAEYHKYYELIRYGDFYRLTAPTEDPFLCDWEFVSPDKTEVLFTRVVMRRPENLFQHKCLRGLDPEKRYTDEETGETYSGALLMHAGINLSPASGRWPEDGESLVKHFTAR